MNMELSGEKYLSLRKMLERQVSVAVWKGTTARRGPLLKSTRWWWYW